jgi:hypothetical protein
VWLTADLWEVAAQPFSSSRVKNLKVTPVGYPETSVRANLRYVTYQRTICLNKTTVNRPEFIRLFWVMLKLGAGDKDGDRSLVRMRVAVLLWASVRFCFFLLFFLSLGRLHREFRFGQYTAQSTLQRAFLTAEALVLFQAGAKYCLSS